MSYILNKQEQKELNKIQKAYYIKPTLSRIDNFVNLSQNHKETWKLVFNELFNIITDAHKEVDLILDERIKEGKIKNKEQASKTVVGNTFPFAVIYIFLHNKIIGNIKDNIFITSQPSTINGFKNITTINIGGETQKPDCDLVIYSVDDNNELINCLILSLKNIFKRKSGTNI